MVALRSRRQDRTLLIVLWLFTALVLVLGVLAVSGILLVWGSVGLLAAIFLTYIHVRDTRHVADEPGAGPSAAQPGSEDPSADGVVAEDPAPRDETAVPHDPAMRDDPAMRKDIEESR
jgi:hypothetical protein